MAFFLGAFSKKCQNSGEIHGVGGVVIAFFCVSEIQREPQNCWVGAVSCGAGLYHEMGNMMVVGLVQ